SLLKVTRISLVVAASTCMLPASGTAFTTTGADSFTEGLARLSLFCAWGAGDGTGALVLVSRAEVDSAERAWWTSSPAPQATRPSPSSRTATVRSRFSSMAYSTPSARAVTDAGSAPAADVQAVATAAADSTAGGAALASCAESSPLSPPADSV